MNFIVPNSQPEFSRVPLIAFVDLQAEHIAQERPYSVSNIEPWFENLKLLLESARKMRFPIAHFRQIRSDIFFNEKSIYSNWIEDFRPRGNEAIYQRALPSCYSNKPFSTYIERIKKPLIVLAGLVADQACLSTVIEAHHRGHQVIYVSDASSNPQLGSLSEEKSHDIVTEIISIYAEVSTTDKVLKKLQSLSPTKLRGYT